MKTHYLKTWTEPFQAVKDGVKTWEYRLNDRDFQVDNVVILEEGSLINNFWIPTGEQIKAKVSYILYGGAFGIPENYCIMSLIDVEHGFERWE